MVGEVVAADMVESSGAVGSTLYISGKPAHSQKGKSRMKHKQVPATQKKEKMNNMEPSAQGLKKLFLPQIPTEVVFVAD